MDNQIDSTERDTPKNTKPAKRRRLVVPRAPQSADVRPATIAERLLRAAESLNRSGSTGRIDSSTRELRTEQVSVYVDFVEYLTEIATRPESERIRPMCRIIQPPRTGKTVIAGHIIGGTKLNAVFLVPTKTLVEQTVHELRAQLPGVDVGMYYGDAKEAVDHGVTVATYAVVQQHAEQGKLPPAFRNAELVFCDEAHQSMTVARSKMLAEAFDPDAVRIALTATPDYNDKRTLARFFPDLIHEITLTEAMDLELLAPLRLWIAEVDEDGSSVKILAGDFQEETIGRLMSSAPFFRAAEVFRYVRTNRQLPAIICCTTRQQAYDLWKYLEAHRPSSAPLPALILGDTPSEERREALERFERGEIDTIVNVGVLIQGWNSPRCKLLIDLAPSISRVRAMQKFFRVMTRQDDDEARIVQILPKDLPRIPLFPTDFLGLSTRYECGTLIGRKNTNATSRTSIERLVETPIEKVRLKHQIALNAEVVGARLDPRNAEEARRVIRSNVSFDEERLIDWSVFRWLEFDHPLFCGRGEQLIRFIGAPTIREGYEQVMTRLFPEAAANRMLTIVRINDPENDPWSRERLQFDRPCREDQGVRELLDGPDDGNVDDQERARCGWRALGGIVDEEPDVETRLAKKEIGSYLRDFLKNGKLDLPTDLRIARLWAEREEHICKFPDRYTYRSSDDEKHVQNNLYEFLHKNDRWRRPLPKKDRQMLLRLVKAQLEAVRHRRKLHRIPIVCMRQQRGHTPIESRCIQLYYGLDPSIPEEQTLREIGKKYGLSVERIRQIILKGLETLRHVIDDIYFGED